MTILELLTLISDQGIKLYVEDGRLRYVAPTSVMTDELRNHIRNYRDPLIKFISEHKTGLLEADVTSSDHRVTSECSAVAVSPSQHELWLWSQLESGVPAYSVSIVIQFEGPLNNALLNQILSALIKRHESLRTIYRLDNGKLQQLTSREVHIHVPIIDLTGLSGERRNITSTRVYKEEASAPIDLSNGPVIRFKLVKVNQQRHSFILTVHHIAMDGWSMDLLVRDFEKLFMSYSQGKKSLLEDLQRQYSDYVVWNNRQADELLESPEFKSRSKLLSSIPGLVFRFEKTNYTKDYWHGSCVSRELSKDFYREVTEFAKSKKVTAYVMMMATLWVVLFYNSKQRDFVVAADYANRDDPDVESIIGLFVTQILVKSSLDGNPSFLEILKNASVELIESSKFSIASTRLVTYKMREQLNIPPFRVKLVAQPPIRSPILRNLKVSSIKMRMDWAKFDLLLSTSINGSNWKWDLVFRERMFLYTDMSRLLDELEFVFKTGINSPRLLLNSLVDELDKIREQRFKRQNQDFKNLKLERFSLLN